MSLFLFNSDKISHDFENKAMEYLYKKLKEKVSL